MSTITTVMEETVEPLKTGSSLIFTIAANGKTWPKRLDLKSFKSDIELKIYSPVLSGCLIRRRQSEHDLIHRYQPLPEVWNDLTVEQQKKINAILAQKNRINHLLGTLMVPYPLQLDERYGKREPEFTKVKVGPENFGHLDGKKGNNYIVRVLDCSYGDICNCTCAGFIHIIKYDDVNFSFVVPNTPSGSRDVREVIKEKQTQNTLIKAFPVSNKFFNIGGDELVVMCGEDNIFDVFSIDDALLILEEGRSSETVSSMSWTLCIAQSQVARNLLRLYSNNSALLAR